MSDEPSGGESNWVDVGSTAEVAKRRKVVIDVGEEQIFVLAHEGDFFALQNICIHRQREISKGVVLNGRIVCPGHQWAFDLRTGWESVKQECQPTYRVRIEDDVVQVDVASRRVLVAPPAPPSPSHEVSAP
jgi:nitrite reductase/ring-hydroxylating ferredoxin subunit